MEADGLLEPVTEDDPEYHKYLENNDPYGIMTMSALWGLTALLIKTDSAVFQRSMALTFPIIKAT